MIKIVFLTILLSFNLAFAAKKISEKEKNDFYKNLKCLVCDGQSVFDSNTDFANDIRVITEVRIREGETLEEIELYLTESFGEEILLSPRSDGSMMLLWLIPYLFLFVGIYIYVRFIMARD